MQHNSPEIHEYATWIREALGLDGPDALPVVGRPLFVGMDPEPPRKRTRRPLPNTMAQLPLEIVRMIFVETLFPHGMLHLNQIRATRGREVRSRASFEADLVAQFRLHREAYNALWGVFPEYRPLLGEPGFRRLFYRKWLAMPVEGLYQRPDPSQMLSGADLRAIQIPAYPDTDDTTGLLSKWWYTDFLATVMYNEWRRAVSMTIARGVQFWFVKSSGEGMEATSEAFRDYWGTKFPHLQRRFPVGQVHRELGYTKEFSLAREEVAFYALEQDLEYQRGHVKNDPLNYGMRVLNPQWLGYQNFEQLDAAYVKPLEGRDTTPYNRDKPNEEQIPFSVEAMWRIMRHRRIEIVRMLRFSNTLQSGVGERAAERTVDTKIVMKNTDQDLLDPTNMGARPLLIVDRAYDVMCLPNRPDLFYAPGGFAPWKVTGRTFLGGFDWNTMVGMREALADMDAPDPLSGKNRFIFISQLRDKVVRRSRTTATTDT